MDLEDELRQAMADHVTGVSAPRTLAHEARRRHQRTVRRRATIAVAAAGVVVAIAVIPTYQAIRPQPVSAPGPEGRHAGTGGTTTAGSAAPSPSTARSNGSTAPSVSPSAKTHAGTRPSRHPGTGSPRGTAPDVVKALLAYLPDGIDPHDTCHTGETGARRTTTCRWTGPAGWIEVRLVRDDSLKGPGDMGFTPASAQHAEVHGHAALRAAASATFGQVMWIERSGLGVWVGVSPTLGTRLMRVAEGVQVD
ncbi:hypothetical protein [Actinoallomurus rhizosphaericola]|uniref:hypothetical protein n=1 Tax=Actinoallomurus rhizosphaericola TaxID=2952536 RepID=UPI002091220D|nr:hypothetical protein [Actinoallomurus rhizosphaericola]MCO5994647.1 hypothetical protein [Actinoallomurus rhizosphaericola]